MGEWAHRPVTTTGMVDGRTQTMILRTTMAAVGLLALGGSIKAVNAAEAAPVPAQIAATEQNLPRFEPSAEAREFEAAFGELGAAEAIAVPEHAVDLAAIEPLTEAAVIDDVPDGLAS